MGHPNLGTEGPPHSEVNAQGGYTHGQSSYPSRIGKNEQVFRQADTQHGFPSPCEEKSNSCESPLCASLQEQFSRRVAPAYEDTPRGALLFFTPFLLYCHLIFTLFFSPYFYIIFCCLPLLRTPLRRGAACRCASTPPSSYATQLAPQPPHFFFFFFCARLFIRSFVNPTCAGAHLLFSILRMQAPFVYLLPTRTCSDRKNKIK